MWILCVGFCGVRIRLGPFQVKTYMIETLQIPLHQCTLVDLLLEIVNHLLTPLFLSLHEIIVEIFEFPRDVSVNDQNKIILATQTAMKSISNQAKIKAKVTKL